MSWGNSEGLKGRCDAKCHNARTPHCDCMCGGVYHGAVRHGRFERIHREQSAKVFADAQHRAQAHGFTLIKGGAFTAAMPSLFDGLIEGGQ